MLRPAFLDQEPPPGYISGIGRGATGFTTSADTGSLQPGFTIENGEESDDNLAGEIGDEGAILASGKNRDKEDEEADQIYEEIERKLQRRKVLKEEAVSEAENQSYEIKSKFSDLKRSLSSISAEQWEALPEVGDITRRNKRTRLYEQQQQRTYAVPDSVIAGSIARASPTNFQSISESRDQLLLSQLDSLLPKHEIEFNAEEATEILKNDQHVQIADIRKGRQILASLRRTQPNLSNSWIASARLEEQATNYTMAKKLIIEGCKHAPKSEDIWLESIRIHKLTSEGAKMCKVIVAESLKYNPGSEKLWIQAENLENSIDVVSRKRILMRAIEAIPSSASLWKRLVDLETNQDDVSKILTKAIELCPTEWDFWLTLINSSEYKDAKTLLNRARKALNGNYQVWITAAKLEERENSTIDSSKISKLMDKAFKETEKSTTTILRTTWLEEAIKAEEEGFRNTCRAIVNSLLSSEINQDNPEENLVTWFQDAETLALKESVEAANYIHQFIVETNPHSINSWKELFSFLKNSSNRNLDTLFNYYKRSIELNPKVEVLHLMYAKDLWQLAGNIVEARKVLNAASHGLENNEEVWFARIKLEIKSGNFEQALSISSKMIKAIPTSSDRVWYKHIHLVRCMNNREQNPNYEGQILALLESGLDSFPESPRLHLQKIQVLLRDLRKPDIARESARAAVEKLPSIVELWILLSHIDEQHLNILIKARSVLDTAILKNPTSDKLWTAKIQLERRNKDFVAARQLVNKGLKAFPKSSRIWIEYLSLIPKMSHRKTAFLDALKSTENSPEILLGIGVFFWLDSKHSKAKSWFERALSNDRNSGECWGWLFNFMKSYGKQQEKENLINSFESHYEEINKGDIWNSTNKDITNFEKTPKEILELVSKVLISKYST